MITSGKIIDKINDYYTTLASIRASKQGVFDDLLKSDNNYVKTLNSLRNLDLLIAKAHYTNSSKNVIEELESNKSVLEENLQKIKNGLLKNVGEYKIDYNCDKCKDTGIIKNKRCSCFYKLLTKYSFDALGINERKFPKFTQTAPQGLEKHYEVFTSYSKKFPNVDVKNFVFTGTVGSGKTYLAGSICNYLKNKNFLPIFLTATELNNLFLKIHLSEIDRNLAFEVLLNADLLVIDDLGTEPTYKNVTNEYLLTLISERLDKQKAFIITTNLTISEMAKRYNERLISRLSNKKETIFVPFKGKDLRQE